MRKIGIEKDSESNSNRVGEEEREREREIDRNIVSGQKVDK